MGREGSNELSKVRKPIYSAGFQNYYQVNYQTLKSAEFFLNGKDSIFW